jgi:hypothetical protein
MLPKLVAAMLATNLAFAGSLIPWVTDNDFIGLRKDGSERFVDLFYFSVASFSTAGYGDISPKSTRAKLFTSIFLLFVYAAAVYGVYNAVAKA